MSETDSYAEFIECKFCGIPVHPNTRFCPECSKDLLESKEKNRAPQEGGIPFFEVLTIAASLASIMQAILMVVDMRSRHNNEKKSSKFKKSTPRGLNEVRRITIYMSDGSHVYFDLWLTEPEKVKSFVGTFNSSSASPKPLAAVFYLKNRTKIIANISEYSADQFELDRIIKYLKS